MTFSVSLHVSGTSFAPSAMPFRAICFRSPVDGVDRGQVEAFTTTFKSGGNLKQVFADVAAYCAGN